MKILVTGGAGYVGSSLVEALATQQDISSVTIYDNLSEKNRAWFFRPIQNQYQHKIKLTKADLLDTRQLKKSLDGIDVVVHLAQSIETNTPQAEHYLEQVNHWGTAELVYAIEQNGNIQKLISTSTAEVYGDSKKINLESDDCKPSTAYGYSKQRAEKHIDRLGSKLPSIILRLADVYGINLHTSTHGLINKLLFDANFSNKISISGTGKQINPHLYLPNLIDILIRLIQGDYPSQTVNICNHHSQVLDLLDFLKNIYPELEFGFINPHLEYPSLQLDTQKMQTLGWLGKNSALGENLLTMKKSLAF
jgi:UDP-glucose 4-epimerase